jgi:DNA repair protein RadC
MVARRTTERKTSTVGSSALTDAELIAIFCAMVLKKQTAIDLARQVLAYCNNDLPELAKAGYQHLAKTKGIGPVKAITLVAAMELGRRCRSAEARKKKILAVVWMQ